MLDGASRYGDRAMLRQVPDPSPPCVRLCCGLLRGVLQRDALLVVQVDVVHAAFNGSLLTQAPAARRSKGEGRAAKAFAVSR